MPPKDGKAAALTEYEEKRAERIADNKRKLDELKVTDAADELASEKEAPARAPKKVKAVKADTQPVDDALLRRSSRAASATASERLKNPQEIFEDPPEVKRKRVHLRPSAKPGSEKPFELLLAAAATGPYEPRDARDPVSECAADPEAPPRDARGGIKFADHPEFRPRLTPKQVIRAGTWGGCYFHPRGGKPGIRHPGGVKIDHKEFPKSWFEGLPESMYNSRKYNLPTNKYGVKCGQDQRAWEESGWIIEQDPRGWFQWYCRFYLGRRTADDARQISRWTGVCGPQGRWKRSLLNKIADANASYNDAAISPVIRQTLLHWAYEVTEQDAREHGAKRRG